MIFQLTRHAIRSLPDLFGPLVRREFGRVVGYPLSGQKSETFRDPIAASARNLDYSNTLTCHGGACS